MGFSWSKSTDDLSRRVHFAVLAGHAGLSAARLDRSFVGKYTVF